VAELQAVITAHVEALRKQHARSGTWKGKRPWEPDLNPVDEHREAPDLNPAVEVAAPEFNPVVEVRKVADFNPVVGADLNPVVATVTSKRTGRKNPPTPSGGNGLDMFLMGKPSASKQRSKVFGRYSRRAARRVAAGPPTCSAL
jgi:hypothetical protein